MNLGNYLMIGWPCIIV